MRILVTGGAGFIGSHIQDKLVSLGHTVAVLDNLRSGRKTNLNKKAKFFEVDICDPKKVDAVFSKFKPEIIFHLAAQNEVPYSMSHHKQDMLMNIGGTLNILKAAHKFGTKKIIYSNTGGALYGEVLESQIPVSEDEPVSRPSSFYGVSKGSAESYIKLFGNLYGLSWVSLRYANVYGPRQLGNKEAGIVAIFTTKMLDGVLPIINGDGGHTRDYIYVGDVVDANIAALNYSKNNYFNISTGVETSNNQVFLALEKALKTGLKPQYGSDRPGDPRRSALSPAKAKRLLKWRAQVPFARGVKQTVEYYQGVGGKI